MKGFRGILAVVATVIVVIGIGFLSLTSRLGHVFRIFGSDKTAHLLAYCFLSIILAYMFRHVMAVQLWQATLWAILISSILGGLFEVIQYFLPHRQADWYDMMANVIGASLGGVLFWFTKIVMR